MSDFQIDSGESDSSGKSGGNQSPTVLILFSVPFLLFGIIALAAAIRNPKMENVSVGYSVGGIFTCVGLGIIIAGFRLRKKARQTSSLQAQHPDQPWLWRADWAEGKIKSSALAQPILMLIMGLAFCGLGGVSTYFALPEVWQKHNYAALVVLFFPLAGLGMLAIFFVAWRSQKRFGNCYFELAQIPIPLGSVLEGMIQTGNPLKLEHELNLKISCVRQVTTGSGKSRSTNEYILWQDEKIYSSHANLPESESGHTGIPVHFKLADGQPQCFTRENVSVFWRLEAKSKMRGPDFRAVFDLPVFKVAGAAVAETDETDANDSDPTVLLQAPIEEIRRDENSKIKISDGPNGREFYFPASRNWQMALWATLGMLFSDAIMAALILRQDSIHVPVPVFWKIFVGFFVFITTWSALGLWFGTIRITVDSTGLRVTSRWLFLSRTRNFPASDVERFETIMGMSGGTLQNIQLISRAGKTISIANGIASSAEANWLVSEMNKALGRK